MKKLLWVMAIVLAAAATGNAQDKRFNIGVGGGLAVPTGDAADISKMGFDIFVNGTYSFTPKLAFGGEINHSSFPSKTFEGIDMGKTNLTAFVVKGVYTFNQKRITPYLAADFGWYKAEEDPGEFGYAGEAGARYKNFGIGIGYHVATSEGFHYLQINVGYRISF
jgi:hypothetical protein